jgi:hypothetical protein
VAVLPRALREDLDDIALTPIGAARPISFAQSLKANYTDGIVVLHRGRIVLERYFGALDEHGRTLPSRSRNRSSARWARCWWPSACSTNRARSRTGCRSSRARASATPRSVR